MKEKKEKKGNFWKPGEKKPEKSAPNSKSSKSPLNKSQNKSQNRDQKQDMSIISRHAAKSPHREGDNKEKPVLSKSVMTMKVCYN